MITLTQKSLSTMIFRFVRTACDRLQARGFTADVIIFIAVLAGLNLHLFGGRYTNLQIFFRRRCMTVNGGACSATPLSI